MGFGIEARFRRNERYWSQHFALCQAFIRRELSPLPSGYSIVILGSGRLYDFPVEALDRASKITLIDADPSSFSVARRKLGRIAKKTRFLHLDCTGCIHSWTKLFQEYLKDNGRNRVAVKEFFSRISPPPFDPIIETHDVAVSLNLLGQIPVYFRERFKSIMLELARIDVDEQDHFPPGIEGVVSAVLGALQKRHVSEIQKISSKKTILIYDRYFHYYDHEYSPWESYPGLYLEKIFPEIPRKTASESWFWHVAPQGVEDPNYGVIHEIEAASFTR